MAVVSMKQLLEAGVHFGHQTRRWNPKMAKYIFTERNGIYIIDLQKTVKKLDEAYNFVRDTAAQGGEILFVGTKKQAQESIRDEATRCGMHYVNARWLGGMMTNFRTIRKRIDRMEQLKTMQEDGTFDLVFANSSVNLDCWPEEVFREAFRVLRPGGVLVFDGVLASDDRNEATVRQAREIGNAVQAAPGRAEFARMMARIGFEGPECYEEADVAPQTGYVDDFEVPVAETDEDVLGIADIAAHVMHAWRESALNKTRGVRITVSTSWFVPKAHTAFQWEPQIPKEEYERRVKLLRENMLTKSVTYNWHDSDTSYMEAVISRGDRRLCRVIETAWRKGEHLSAWEEYFSLDRWLEAFEECGLDPHFYANRKREKDELMPWSMISSGVTEQYLWREHERCYQSVTTPDCRTHCNGCGANLLLGRPCDG